MQKCTHIEAGDRELRSRERTGEVAMWLPEPDVVAEEENDGARWSRRVGRTIKEERLGAEPAITRDVSGPVTRRAPNERGDDCHSEGGRPRNPHRPGRGAMPGRPEREGAATGF